MPDDKDSDTEVGSLPLFSYSAIHTQYHHPQDCKAQVILPTSHTVEAALEITLSQVSEEIPLYIIIIIITTTTTYFCNSICKLGNAINIIDFTFTNILNSCL